VKWLGPGGSGELHGSMIPDAGVSSGKVTAVESSCWDFWILFVVYSRHFFVGDSLSVHLTTTVVSAQPPRQIFTATAPADGFDLCDPASPQAFVSREHVTNAI
jgi:hypothetical protein